MKSYTLYMTLYMSNYMTFWKRQNYGDSKKISGWLPWIVTGKKMNRQSIEDFRAVKILCMKP